MYPKSMYLVFLFATYLPQNELKTLNDFHRAMKLSILVDPLLLYLIALPKTRYTHHP